MKENQVARAKRRTVIVGSSLALFTVLASTAILSMTTQNGLTATTQEALSGGTPLATSVSETPNSTPVSTYSTEALLATAVALEQTLPTASPIPGIPDYKAADYQKEDLWNRAISTAKAIYPPPPDFSEQDFFTPIPHTPMPTAAVPQRVTNAGTIYDTGWPGPPCNRIKTENHWYGYVDGKKTHVCAGRALDYPYEGIILLEVWGAGQEVPGRAQLFPISDYSGKLSIFDVVDSDMTLGTEDNRLVHFDLTHLQWSPMPPPSSVTPVLSPTSSP